MVIYKQYNVIINNFFDSLNLEFLNWAEQTDIKTYNALKSKVNWANLFEKYYLNKNIPNKLSQPVSKIKNQKICQCYFIAT